VAEDNIKFIDCHVPRIIKGDWGDAAQFSGDVRTHMVGIDPEPIGQFTQGGRKALSKISLDFLWVRVCVCQE